MAFSRNLAIWVALAALASAATPAQAGDVKRGAQLYNFCAQCHGADGAGNELYLAPNLTGLPDWHLRSQLRSFWTGLRGLHPDDVAGLRMYPMAKTFNGERAESDIEAVSAYIATLPVQVPAPTLVGGDPERGASFYQVAPALQGRRARLRPAQRQCPDHARHGGDPDR